MREQAAEMAAAKRMATMAWVVVAWVAILLTWQRLAQLPALSGAVGGTIAAGLCLGSIVAGLVALVWAGVRVGELALATLAASIGYWVARVSNAPTMAVQVLFNVFLSFFAASVGALVARLVQKPGYLLPVVIVVSLADVWSVYRGPTREIVERPEIVPAVTVSFPRPGTGEMAPTIGAADLVFIAFFLAASRAFGLGLVRGLLGIGAGLAAAVAVLAMGREVPALPFMGIGYVAANWRRLGTDRKDLITTVRFAVAMLLIMGLVSLIRYLTGR